jgi:hypothetical protein
MRDRRTELRTGTERGIRLLFDDGHSWRPGTVRELAVASARIRSAVPLEVGTRLDMVLDESLLNSLGARR